VKAPEPQVDNSKPATPANDYLIGADDILSVSVWKESDLSRTLPVRPDGKISLPLIGDVQAAGKTPQALQKELRASLAAYIAVPEVTVIVQEVKSVKFNVVGEVVKPGSYPLTESVTVLDAIAQAGGLGVYAKSNSIYVLRVRPDGSSYTLPFRYKQVLKGLNQAQNINRDASRGSGFLGHILPETSMGHIHAMTVEPGMWIAIGCAVLAAFLLAVLVLVV